MTSTSCRILLAAPTFELGTAFIERLKELGTPLASVAGAEASYTPVPSIGEENIRLEPWTIRNKYYSADVHLALVDAAGWRVRYAIDAPAVVFVWEDGAAYREMLQQIHSDLSLSRIDPEVCLAVRVKASADSVPSSTATSDEDAESMDEFAASCGFEFVDDTRPSSARTIEHEDDMPGLPRVLDALSTIMWPSMVQAPREATRGSRPMNLLGLGAQDDHLALVTLLQGVSDVDPARDLAELERWLEEDEPTDTASHNGSTALDNSFEDLPTPGPHARGFDDDFAEFVSAPALSTGDERLPTFALVSEGSVPVLDTSFDATYDFDAPRSPLVSTLRPAGSDFMGTQRLTPMHTGASWASLDSTSDADVGPHVRLGSTEPSVTNEDSDQATGSDDEDAALPSQAEVRATTARIFGSNGGTASLAANKADFGSAPPLDLGHVLASLEGLKAEIAGMPDDDARRQAAARVALGLVHGLALED